MNYAQIKSFEDACKALNVDATLPDFAKAPQAHQKALLAHYKLVLIVQAVNEGWQPKWEDSNEYKYELCPDIIAKESGGFGLAYDGYDYWYSATFVGSRLCFKSREIAKYTLETFKDLYEDYLLIG
jgi:hypothetical protein